MISMKIPLNPLNPQNPTTVPWQTERRFVTVETQTKVGTLNRTVKSLMGSLKNVMSPSARQKVCFIDFNLEFIGGDC